MGHTHTSSNTTEENSKHHPESFTCYGNLASAICASFPYMNSYYIYVLYYLTSYTLILQENNTYDILEIYSNQKLAFNLLQLYFTLP
jgi:hypothetical protein